MLHAPPIARLFVNSFYALCVAQVVQLLTVAIGGTTFPQMEGWRRFRCANKAACRSVTHDHLPCKIPLWCTATWNG